MCSIARTVNAASSTRIATTRPFEAKQVQQAGIDAYSRGALMPNHWHLLLWPRRDGDLSQYMRLVTLTHTALHAGAPRRGTDRSIRDASSFVVQDDRHFVAVARYVEANALNGDLVQRAEAWR